MGFGEIRLKLRCAQRHLQGPQTIERITTLGSGQVGRCQIADEKSINGAARNRLLKQQDRVLGTPLRSRTYSSQQCLIAQYLGNRPVFGSSLKSPLQVA